MNENTQPLLLLESPHVGDVGHAWVVSARGSLEPDEVAIYRGDGQHRIIRATRSVTQRATGRGATETLLVAKAAPSQERDDETVRSVLREILEAEITPESLRRGEVRKDRADIFTAHCMERATQRFLADQRIRDISWAPLVHQPESRPGRHRSINMKKLVLMIFLLILAVGVAMLSFDHEPKIEIDKGSLEQTVSFGDFEFLTTSPWQEFMRVTGGSEAREKIQDQWEKSMKTPESGGSIFDKLSGKGSKNDTALSEKEGDALEMTKVWWNGHIAKEFGQGRVETNKDMLGLSKIKIAEVLSDGGAGSWYTNQKNHHERLKKVGGDWLSQALVLEEFRTSTFPSLDPGELGERIGKLLGIVVELKASDDNAKNLNDLIKKLKGSLARPDGLKIPSCRDAERLKKMKEILGHKEMGFTLGIGSQETLESWEGIKTKLGEIEAKPADPRKQDSLQQLQDFFGKRDGPARDQATPP